MHDDTISIHGHLGRDWPDRCGLDPDGAPAALDLAEVTSVDGCGVEELISVASRSARRRDGLRLDNIPLDVCEDLLRLGLGDLRGVRRLSA